MCKGMDEWEAQAREEGIEQGRNVLVIEKTLKKLNKGNTPKEIAEALEEDISVIEKICRVIESCKPDCTIKKILEKLA